MMRNTDPAPVTYAEWEDAQDELDRLRAEVVELLPFVKAVAIVQLWRDVYPDGPDLTVAGMNGKRPTIGAQPDDVRKARAILARIAAPPGKEER